MNFKLWRFLCSIFAILTIFSSFINAKLLFTRITSQNDIENLLISIKNICSEDVQKRNSLVFSNDYMYSCSCHPGSTFIHKCTDDDAVVGMFIVDKWSYEGDLRLSELLVRKNKYGNIDKVMTRKILDKIKSEILPETKTSKLVPETAVYKCYEFYFNPQVENNNKNKTRSNSMPKSKK